MLEFITAYIEQHQLLPDQGRVVVAVSGGADSLCLLHLLHRLCGPGQRYSAVQLHVAHLDHQLRGEVGESDAACVARIAEDWGLPVTLGSCDVARLAREERRSLEEAARVARYHFLREVAQGAPIAVAHHQDDQVETLILHWLRGGGIVSMVGLRPRQRDIIRPLLCISRADTLAYCQQYQLAPLEDASNADTRFLRNRVRHEVLPLLASINPGIRETLIRNAETLRIDAEWIEAQVDTCWPRVVSEEPEPIIAIPALIALPLSLRRHLLRRAASRLHNGQSPLETRHYQLIEQLIQHTGGEEQSLDLPGQLRAIRRGGTLVFTQARTSTQPRIGAHESVQLTIPGQSAVPGTAWRAVAEFVQGQELQAALIALQHEDWRNVWRILRADKYTVYVDGARLGAALYVRTRRPGDRMRPLGMAHEKKVQDILVDSRIARHEREQIPLFFAAEHCIWLAGIHIDDRVRLTGHTRLIVRLSIDRG